MSVHRGVTLTEILIAIFVMGVGLIALVGLFPLGILSVRQANLDTRASILARSARETISLMGMLRSPTIIDPSNDGDIFGSTDADNLYSKGKKSGDAYPVVIDPLGYAAYSTVYPGMTKNFGTEDR